LDVLSRLLVKLFVGVPEEPLDVEARARYGVFQGTLSIIGNIVLAALKFFFGWITNSIALLADAVHTGSDVVTSAIVVAGFRMAKKPADIEHPYGHGRIEPIATLIISLLLIWAGIEFAHAAYDRLRDPPRVEWSTLAFSLMAVSVAFKEWMARFALGIGKIVQSDMLKADAWHHRSDAAASVLVAISLLAAYFGHVRIDSILGFCVAGLIMYAGFRLLRSMVNELLGKAPSKELIDRIVKAGLSVEGVKQIHDINVHDYGQQKVISLHVVTARELETHRSHHLAKMVEKAVGDALNASTVVHVDPSDPSESSPSEETVKTALKRVVQVRPEIQGFEGLKVSAFKGGPVIDFRLVMNGKLSLERAHEIGRDVANDLKKCVGDCKVSFSIGPGHSQE